MDLFTSELANGFASFGTEVFIYDMQHPSTKDLADFCAQPVDAVVTFNTMFFNMLVDNDENAWHHLNIPFITILVDHPIAFADTLLKFNKKDKVFCIDKDHQDYISRFYPNIGYVGFLPHGGTTTEIGNYFFDDISYHERKIDVLYAGGIPKTDINELTLPGSITQKYRDIFDISQVVSDIYQLALQNYDCPLETVVEAYMQNMIGELDNASAKMLIDDFHFLHENVLSFYRFKILEKAAESGAELYIYGTSEYNKFSFTQLPNVHLMGFVPPEEVLSLMRESKIVLSSMAWFKNGSHERIFNGMLAGAVVISEESIYINEAFCNEVGNPNQAIFTYSLDNLDMISLYINSILSDELHSSLVAQNGFQKAMESHTWRHRAEELLTYL